MVRSTLVQKSVLAEAAADVTIEPRLQSPPVIRSKVRMSKV